MFYWNGAFTIKNPKFKIQNSKLRPGKPEGPPKVPGYIVTYSDMVTLLLTFFVMLLSLASVQDPELFYMGRGSFVQSIRGLGLGILYGRKPRPDFGSVKIKYFISAPDKLLQVRTIDAKQEELRRIFKKISRSMTTMPSQIVAQKTSFSVTNIRFSPGEASLDKSAKRILTEFCLNLQACRGAGSLYVLGLADEQTGEKQQWLLSARRAQAVADFLQSALGGPAGSPEAEPSGPAWDPVPASAGTIPAFAGMTSPPHKRGLPLRKQGRQPWRIYWWGAGPGGDWVEKDSPISRTTYGGQILIAVLRATD
ncbi:MAG: flagellar motor protein MotB [Sedimentisphaerales bacterium]